MQDEYLNSSIAMSNSSPSSLNPLWLTYSPLLNSNRSTTSQVRHNFRSIDELLSPIPLKTNDDIQYHSQLSTSIQSQKIDDHINIENVTPSKSSITHKKLKKIRTAFTDDQKQYLDHFYLTNRYPDPTHMETLSSLLQLDEKIIRVWFQNKRSREKNHSRNSTTMNTM